MNDLICDLVKETDPFLKEIPVGFDFKNPQVDPEKLSEQLIENMIHYKGYGLSANQIGIPITVFAMIHGESAFTVFNPNILEWSPETTYIKEGCLSFPGLWMAVERAKGIATTFQLADGEEQSGNFIDLSARVFQHEYEHMEGALFIDNVSDIKLKSAQRKRNIYLRRLKRKNKVDNEFY